MLDGLAAGGGDRQLAEDVTQTVFINLVRMGKTLSSQVALGGWLHQHTVHVATKAARGENRRRVREKEAVEMTTLESNSDAGLAEAAPYLDEAITQLGAEDRTAIVLRFFEQRDFRSVGEALGSNEDATRMRVNRAVDKLHGLLKQRGVRLSAAGLGVALAAEGVTAVPAGLPASVTATAVASAATGGITFTLLKVAMMTKLKAGIIVAVVLASVATPLVIQHHAQVKLAEKDRVLQQQSEQLAYLESERQRLSNLVAQASPSRSLPDDQLGELLRLRNEVSALR